MLILFAPEAPIPTRRRSSPVGARGGENRSHAQQARVYANLWYLALLAWEVETARPVRPPVSYQAQRDHREGNVSTLGEFLPDQKFMLNLPNGQHLEGEVSQLISRMMRSRAFETSENGHLLDTLRDSGKRKPDSLLRPDGNWQRQTSPAWGLAVLSLAVQLRDAQAGQYLAYCRRAFERASGEAE